MKNRLILVTAILLFSECLYGQEVFNYYGKVQYKEESEWKQVVLGLGLEKSDSLYLHNGSSLTLMTANRRAYKFDERGKSESVPQKMIVSDFMHRYSFWPNIVKRVLQQSGAMSSGSADFVVHVHDLYGKDGIIERKGTSRTDIRVKCKQDGIGKFSLEITNNTDENLFYDVLLCCNGMDYCPLQGGGLDDPCYYVKAESCENQQVIVTDCGVAESEDVFVYVFYSTDLFKIGYDDAGESVRLSSCEKDWKGSYVKRGIYLD